MNHVTSNSCKKSWVCVYPKKNTKTVDCISQSRNDYNIIRGRAIVKAEGIAVKRRAQVQVKFVPLFLQYERHSWCYIFLHQYH